MFHFREPAGAVLAALAMVEELPAAGLPPAHVGVAAGPVVAQGGDYFGRTVNLAARIAAHADAGQVLVSQSVIQASPPDGVRFVQAGPVQLKGFARPVRAARGQPVRACRSAGQGDVPIAAAAASSRTAAPSRRSRRRLLGLANDRVTEGGW
jgi:class 3 adenylate cyclase